MGLREQIAAAVSQIRSSRYGRDVRSGIADGIEKTVDLMTVEAIRTYKGTSEPSTTATQYDGIKLNDRYLKMADGYDSETETGMVEKQFYCSKIARNRAGSPTYVEWTETQKTNKTYRGNGSPSGSPSDFDGIEIGDEYLQISGEEIQDGTEETIASQWVCSKIVYDDSGVMESIEWMPKITPEDLRNEFWGMNDPSTDPYLYPGIKAGDLYYKGSHSGQLASITDVYICAQLNANHGGSIINIGWIKLGGTND